ncbi:MAG: EAL domain-containing protein [Actinobacteria bacterium]|nr:EAL domain-containing protein [Actinomycetota bacterium]
MVDSFVPSSVVGSSGDRVLHRGTHLPDGMPVLIEVVPTSASIGDALREEYNLQVTARVSWSLQPLALESHGTDWWVVLEWFEGRPLDSGDHDAVRTVVGADRIPEFVELAVAVTGALQSLHDDGVIHRGLDPRHILYDRSTRCAKLLGLRNASRADRRAPAPGLAAVLAAGVRPQYLSPELTGWTCGAADRRSDLYMLGVVLYEQLVGKLPFDVGDPLGWVRAHVAREPAPVADARGDVPERLCAVLTRLLAKHPEDRYQTAAEVLADLSPLSEHAVPTMLAAGGQLVRDGFYEVTHVSRRLFGRERHVSALRDALRGARSANQFEVALVSGPSGSGKSALAHEVHHDVALAGGYLAVGKHDQLGHGAPYSALAEALGRLAEQVLTEQPGAGVDLRALRDAVGANGGLLVELVPSFEALIGPQDPAVPLPPQESEARFQRLLRRVLCCFAQPAHPLVLVLDDLQWVDDATVRFLESLVTVPEQMTGLLVAVFRDDEIDSSHRLTRWTRALPALGKAASEHRLGPLTHDEVTALIGDLLRSSPRDVAAIADVLVARAGGNPLFIRHLLGALHRDDLISRDPATNGWRLDLPALRGRQLADGTVALIAERLGRLGPPTSEVLAAGGCLGRRFDQQDLALVTGLTTEDVDLALAPALEEGIVRRGRDRYEFTHDRVQEAALSLLNTEQRRRLEVRIGRALASRPEALRDDRVFEVAAHYNRAAGLVSPRNERLVVAEINLAAGRRARATGAFASAVGYLEAALSLLDDDAWEEDHDLSFGVHLELAECASMAADLPYSMALLEKALKRATSVPEITRVRRLEMRLLQLDGRYLEAVDVAEAALRLCGVDLPASEAELDAATSLEIARVDELLSGRDVASLAEVPLTDEVGARSLIGLLAEAIPLVYVARPALWPLVTAKGVDACLRRGHVEESPFVYSCYAMVLGGPRGDADRAQEFSRMALDLNRRSPAAAVWHGKLLFHHASVINIWHRPFSESLPLLDEAFRACVDAGDLVHAGYLTYNAVWLHLEAGTPLDQVAALASRYGQFADETGNATVRVVVGLQELAARHLMGPPPPTEDTALQQLSSSGFGIGLAYHHVLELVINFHDGDLDEALSWADKAETVLPHVATMATEAKYYFYLALTLTALLPKLPPAQAGAARRRLDDAVERLEAWSQRCPENFGSPAALVAAEIARIEGRDLDAVRLYDRALVLGGASRLPHQEGLAAELGSCFHRAAGNIATARAYAQHAADRYALWGAGSLVLSLRRTLTAPETPERGNEDDASAIDMDVASTMAAARAISAELTVDGIHSRLLQAVLEHGLATRGWLVLVEEAGPVVAMTGVVGPAGVQVGAARVGTDTDLPATDVNDVVRAQQDDAQQGTRADPVVLTTGGEEGRRSLLVSPLIGRGRLVALLCLENEVLEEPFAAPATDVVAVLTAQAAVSLETAERYADLQQENAERRRAETAVRMLNRQLSFNAQHDDLTGLPNRSTVLDLLQTALTRAGTSGRQVAVLLVDLDDFKSVNDTFGHIAADGFLVHVSRRISECLRGNDKVARLGGDEFVVVCEDLSEPADVQTVAQRIRSALASDIPVADRRIGAPASIGIAVSSPDSTPEQLIQDADTAMYAAKRQGGRRWEAAGSLHSTTASRLLALESELRDALDRRELHLLYQPILDLGTHSITGVEALIRWTHPQRGPVGAEEIIQVAERRNLIDTLGAWVVETACHQGRHWLDELGAAAPKISVNISPRQLRTRDLPALVDAALTRSKLPANSLCLELTESQFLGGDLEAISDLVDISRTGVSIAIDDFGAGFAGIDYIRRLPVTTLKIDKSYIERLGHDRIDTAIVAAVVALANSLGLQTVAEGVTTENQMNTLKWLGCTQAQGWLWHPALAAEDVEGLIRDRGSDGAAATGTPRESRGGLPDAYRTS